MGIEQLIKNEVLILDGAMGTYLQKSGLKSGELPEKLNITNSELIKSIHYEYLLSGSDVITTNTFGASRHKLETENLSVDEIVTAGVKNAQSAIDKFYNEYGREKEKFVALDLGPIGMLIEPMGTMSFDEAYTFYKEQIIAGEKAGCDVLLFETQSSLYELKAGILAAKEHSHLPIFVSMTFTENHRTFSGTDVISMITCLNDMDIHALGINCSFGPEDMLPLVKEIVQYAEVPVLVQPNAGLPKIVEGTTVYDCKPEDFNDYLLKMNQVGVTIFGGCCGTDNRFIKVLSQSRLDNQMTYTFGVNRVEKMTRICSGSKTVTLGQELKVIGERLNPTGKKRLKEALKNHEIEYLLKEGILQVDQGADILDVNVGLPDINEIEMMKEVVKSLQGVLDVPLQIDASNYEALESGARYYNGKPLLNSVSGKKESLEKVLPIAKKYGCCVLGLTLDDEGIPTKAEERLKVAEKIVAEATRLGIPKENILIDCLVLTASAQQEAVKETLKAVQLVKEKLGVATVLGVSNVSFGLPNRNLINSTFLSMAILAGLDAPIMNPSTVEMMGVVNASKVLLNQDKQSNEYIKKYSEVVVKTSFEGQAKKISSNNHSTMDLQSMIKKGLKEEVQNDIKNQLKSREPMSIIKEDILPALNEVGEDFENQKIFLPQLIQSAEAVNKGFELIRAKILESGNTDINYGKIVMATVKDDIHDIGKNIVKVVLQSYGFTIIDLGKDVAPQKVVDVCLKEDIRLVGLSALMTTTVVTMEETIALLKSQIPDIKVFVGGAVLNEKYAKMVNADYYCKDAKASVEVAKNFFDVNI